MAIGLDIGQIVAGYSMLGALVLIRTTLSWSLSVEIDGCWPWQARALAGAASRERPGAE